jgi:hypothetical protein
MLITKLLKHSIWLMSLWSSVLAWGSEPNSNQTSSNLYPQVSEVNGQAQVIGIDSQSRLLKARDVLKERADLSTGPSSSLKILLSSQAQLILSPNTQVKLPVIAWEGGEAKRIELLQGEIRLVQKDAIERDVVTALTQDRYPDSDILISYNPKEGKVNLLVVQGKVFFRGLQNEEGLHLEQGDQTYFQGVFESGELTYDMLLKGRKVARGSLGPVEKTPPERIEKMVAAILVKPPPPPPPPPPPQPPPRGLRQTAI